MIMLFVARYFCVAMFQSCVIVPYNPVILLPALHNKAIAGILEVFYGFPGILDKSTGKKVG